jgi:hypothetical protein
MGWWEEEDREGEEEKVKKKGDMGKWWRSCRKKIKKQEMKKENGDKGAEKDEADNYIAPYTAWIPTLFRETTPCYVLIMYS